MISKGSNFDEDIGSMKVESLKESGAGSSSQYSGTPSSTVSSSGSTSQKIAIESDFVYECRFSDLVWLCNHLFSQSKSRNKTNKRIFVFTNSENPCKFRPEDMKIVRQKVNDLEENDVEFFLFPIAIQQKSKKFEQTGIKEEGTAKVFFDMEQFWGDVLLTDEDGWNGMVEMINNFEDLDQQIRCKEYTKRSLVSAPFEITKNLIISIKMYCTIRPADKPNPVYLHKDTNEPLKSATKWMCKETGEYLEDYQIRTYHLYNHSEKIFFTKDEMLKIKNFGKPSLKLFGFKDQDQLRVDLNVKNSYFMWADESKIEGSTSAFISLVKSCIKKKKFGLALWIARKRANPRFVALLPQKQILDTEIDELTNKKGVEVNPQAYGFHVIFLPWADEIRKPPASEISQPASEQVSAAKEVVAALSVKFPFVPEDFRNPTLHRFYDHLENLALNTPGEGDFEDLTLPNHEYMERHADILQKFSDICRLDEPPPKKKRATASRKKKPVNAAEAKQQLAEIGDFKELASMGKLSKLTVPKLKLYCKQHGLTTTKLRKAEIIEKIKNHLGVPL